MKNNLSPAAHALSVFCPSVPGSVAARSLGLSLEAKAKVKKYRHRCKRSNVQEIIGDEGRWIQVYGKRGKVFRACSNGECYQSSSKERIDIIAEKPGAHQA